MNHHEIEACVIRAKAGNQEDLLKILNQYKPCIYKTTDQFNIRNYDNYDLLQIGYIALIKAVSKYRTGTHTFSSYAFKCIKNTFRYTARQNKKYSQDMSLNISVDTKTDGAVEFIECIEDALNLEESILNYEKINEVRSAVAKLPEDEMELILMVYYSEIPLKTYASKKGISYTRALTKRNKILEKLGCYIKK